MKRWRRKQTTKSRLKGNTLYGKNKTLAKKSLTYADRLQKIMHLLEKEQNATKKGSFREPE